MASSSHILLANELGSVHLGHSLQSSGICTGDGEAAQELIHRNPANCNTRKEHICIVHLLYSKTWPVPGFEALPSELSSPAGL